MKQPFWGTRLKGPNKGITRLLSAKIENEETEKY